jgi:hypothetical protein
VYFLIWLVSPSLTYKTHIKELERMTNNNPSGFKLDGRTIGIIALIAIAAIILLPQLLGGNNNANNNDDDDDNGGVVVPTAGEAERDTSANDDDGIELGNIVTATNLDRNGCPTETTQTYNADDIIYVVAEDSEVPEGTRMFVRFYFDGEIYEESEEITADQDYENTCIAFTLEPDSRPDLREGEYEAEFIINGNPAETVTFEVE